MSEEERDAVKDVISEKIENYAGSSASSGGGTRHRCPHCPISFTQEDNLAEHLERKHKVARRPRLAGTSSVTSGGVRIIPVVGGGSVVRPVMPKSGNVVSKLARRHSTANIKFESVRADEEDEDDPLGGGGSGGSPAARKMQRRKMKQQTMSKINNTGNNSKAQAEPGADPGDGKDCPICDKNFTNNISMRRHFEDIHCPGEYPCRGCGRVFTSKNKVSSHYSRNCKSRDRRSL